MTFVIHLSFSDLQGWESSWGGSFELKVLGERSGKGARVSAGFRVVWEGGLAAGGFGRVFKEGRKRTFPGWLSLFSHFLSFLLSCVYHSVIVLIISRIAQDFGDHFSIISRMVRIPEINFNHSQKGRGFGDHSYFTTRMVEDSRHRTHTGGKDIWPDLLHHKQHNFYDSRIRRFGRSRSKIENM